MKRQILSQLGLRCGLLLVALLALAGSVWWDNAVNRGMGADGPTPALALVPRGGVNVYNLQYEVTHDAQGRLMPDNKVARTMRMIREGGFHWVRVQFPWEDIEICGKGNFQDCHHANQSTWLKYNYIVEQATANGLELIVRLDRPPDWARRGWIATPEVQAQLKLHRPVTGPPDRLEDFGDYVAAVAQHYPQVQYFQIWNEPNLQAEWNYHQQEPAELVKLLRIARTRIRAVHPQAVVLFPSLAPTDGLDGTGINDLDYLAGVYAAGGRDTFDVLGAQLYGLGQSPAKHRYVRIGKTLLRPIDTRADVSRVVLLHEIMARNGDGAKAVWVTELGWNSAPPGLPQPWGSSVSEEQKGQYLIGALERARQEWPWMGAMCVWMFRFGGEQPNAADPTPYFQLVTFDFQPLPAYSAVRDYLLQPLSPLLALNPLRHLLPALTGLVALSVIGLTGSVLPVIVDGLGGVLGTVVQRSWRIPRPVLRGVQLRDRWILLGLALALLWFYRASAQLPLPALGALVFVPLALWRPDLALLLVPVVVPLYLRPKGIWDERFGIRPTGVFVPLHEVVLLSVVAGFLVHYPWRALVDRLRPITRTVLIAWLPLFLFLVAGTLGVLVVPHAGRGDALRAWRWWIVEPVLFYGLVRWYGRTELWRGRILAAWLGTGVVVALIGLLQVAGVNLVPLLTTQPCFSDAVVATEAVRRATSVYCHPNNMGLALGRVWSVLLALGLTIPASLEVGAQRLGRRYQRMLLIALAGVVLLGLVVSFSKGAYIGSAGAVLALGYLLRRRWLLVLTVVAVVLVMGYGFVKGIERLNPLGGSSEARVELWQSAAMMLRDHPLFGVGLDQFLRLRDPGQGSHYIAPEAATTSERFASHPHNVVLDTLLQTGWLGLVALGWLVVRMMRRGLRGLSQTQGWECGLRAGLIAALVAALLHGLVDNFYFVSDLAFNFWLIIALLGGYESRTTATSAEAAAVMTASTKEQGA